MPGWSSACRFCSARWLLSQRVLTYLPADALNTFPVILRPTLGNGFVVGIVSVLVLEHLVFRHVEKEAGNEYRLRRPMGTHRPGE
jgi:hypothetical protein